MQRYNLSLFESFKKRAAETLSFGPESTAIKILHRILELDQKNSAARIHEKDTLIKKLSDALEITINYKKYQNLQEEHKIAIREAIACELHEKSKEWETNCIHYVEIHDFQCATSVSKTNYPQPGLSYNPYKIIIEDRVTYYDNFHSVQFPDNFYIENLAPHVQHALGNIRFLSKNLLLLLNSTSDKNSFFAKIQLPKDVMHFIGKNMVELENSQLKL